MPALDFVLLDLDGVLLNNDEYSPEFDRLAESAFVPLLGGEAASWVRHHEAVWRRVQERGWQEYVAEPGLRGLNLARWWDRVHAEWIEEACIAVGVEPPPTFEQRVDAAERVLAHFFQNTQSVVPEAAATIHAVSEAHQVHMASGNPGWVVETVLDRLTVRDRVGHPFGSDLVGFQKGHDQFYPTILDAVGAKADQTIVVDDGDDALARAARLGIVTVKVGAPGDAGHDHRIQTISELPALLCSLS